MKKLSIKATMKAMNDSGGIILTIAKRLKVEWHTAKKYIDSHPELLETLENEKEKWVDVAETQLLNRVLAGDNDMVKWFLSKQGKNRGYSDRLELKQTNMNIDLNTLTREQLQALADGSPIEKVLDDK